MNSSCNARVDITSRKVSLKETRVRIRRRWENPLILLINDAVKEDTRCHCCNARHDVCPWGSISPRTTQHRRIITFPEHPLTNISVDRHPHGGHDYLFRIGNESGTHGNMGFTFARISVSSSIRKLFLIPDDLFDNPLALYGCTRTARLLCNEYFMQI